MTTFRPATGLPVIDEGLEARLADGLAAVDARLRDVVDHDDPFLAEASGYLVNAGGKRFRPLLTLLCAEAGGAIDPRVVEAAVGVELTHLASLYHDDVMDAAELRRGVPSANLRYGNSTAILVGDLLFGTASRVIAELGPHAVRIQAETFVRLCAGQIRDERGPAEGEDPVAAYLHVLADKTGALIATAARYGAMLGGGDETTVSTLTEFGERLGVVFQLADDLLDVTSEAGDSGKTPGTDLREGKATLPVLYALGSRDPADARLRGLLSGPVAAGDVPEALSLLRRHPAMAQARQHTLGLAEEARTLLGSLRPGPAVDALDSLVEGVALRSS